MSVLIKQFAEIRISDVNSVGGKNASLGEMVNQLSSRGIAVPDGFATTADAFRHFLSYNSIDGILKTLMGQLDKKTFLNLKEIGSGARKTILNSEMPADLAEAIKAAYKKLEERNEVSVAVRSSATAEDLPQVSFAGQHESYLNIKGESELIRAIQKCYASLYTDRAIKYREDNGFEHEKVALSVGIQRMVRSDQACSGVSFTLEPESGFRNVIHIAGVWGLGENMVQGTVNPDEFLVFKPTLQQGKNAIIQKRMGDKSKTMIYTEDSENPVINTDTPGEKKNRFILTDEEITLIARWSLMIEQHYAKPMDIEWAKDGLTNRFFIIQARPETVHSQMNPLKILEYHLLDKGELLTSGEAIGNKVASGIARILSSPDEGGKLQPGEIVVTDLTSPDWDPLLKNAVAIVTNKGGRTSHASIVAREIGIPAVVGCGDATTKIQDGEMITVSCCEGKAGFIYRGRLNFVARELDFSRIKLPETRVMMIVGDPEKAFKWSFYPNDGVGLMRLEFIITNAIRIHPMALVKFHELRDERVRQQIEEITHYYPDKGKYFTDHLAQAIATTAAAFYPKEVIVRMSDFKTNEYASLLGGKDFEPSEENPMLGFRGASRYYNDLYKEGFRLECEAIRIARDEMGFTNIKVMIPFCRTVEEGKKVIQVMKDFGLQQGTGDLEIYVMAEIPNNIFLAEQFAKIFDGFSIGSNDLTQLILGIDRDSAIIADLFNEQNDGVKQQIALMIHKAKEAGVKIGLCGQAPSDFPEFAQFLVKEHIDSISFNPDSIIQGIKNIQIAEATLHPVFLGTEIM